MTTPSSPVVVVFCVDAANLNHTAVVMRSVVTSAAAGRRFEFHIIFDGDDPGRVAAFEKIAGPFGVRFHSIPHNFDKVAPFGHVSSTALLRTQIPAVLSDRARAIYLDADMIVRRDLSELFDLDLDGAAMAGVVDIGMYALVEGLTVVDEKTIKRHMAEVVGLDPTIPRYINSGLLVMDLDALRELDFSVRSKEEFDRRGAEFIWRDQDLINYLLAGKIKILDPRWNVLASFMLDIDGRRHVPPALRQALALQEADQWIIHYTTGAKPWNSPNVWKTDLWWEIAAPLRLDWERPRKKVTAFDVAQNLYHKIVPYGIRRGLAPTRIAVGNFFRRRAGKALLVNRTIEARRRQVGRQA